MPKMITAWDARTGKKLPGSVPQEWFDRDLFPNLTDKEPKGAGKSAPASAEKKGS